MTFTKIERDGKDQPCLTLIGMAGAGKSTLAPMIAEAMGWAFFDTDRYIEAYYAMPLQEVYDTFGHAKFLQIEEKLVSEVKLFRTVISTGGSVVYGPKAIEALKKLGPVVYLQIDHSTFRERVGDAEGRGLAVGPNQTMDDIYHERQPLYAAAADITVRTDTGSPEDAVREILDKVNFA